MAMAGEVTRHGRAHPYLCLITIVSLRSKESEERTTSVSETELLRHVSCCHVSARIRRMPVPFPPGTKSTWGLPEVHWTFSQHSTVSYTPIPQERSDADSESTPNPAGTPSARAYSFTSWVAYWGGEVQQVMMKNIQSLNILPLSKGSTCNAAKYSDLEYFAFMQKDQQMMLQNIQDFVHIDDGFGCVFVPDCIDTCCGL